MRSLQKSILVALLCLCACAQTVVVDGKTYKFDARGDMIAEEPACRFEITPELAKSLKQILHSKLGQYTNNWTSSPRIIYYRTFASLIYREKRGAGKEIVDGSDLVIDVDVCTRKIIRADFSPT